MGRRGWRSVVASGVLLLATVGSRTYSSDYVMDLPQEIRQSYRNWDPSGTGWSGNCVSCSVGMGGAWVGSGAGQSILYDSPYGAKHWGGTNPDTLRSILGKRGVEFYCPENVDTAPWLEWACRTYRGAAISWRGNHFVWLCGMREDGSAFRICDNNSPEQYSWIERDEFLWQHRWHPKLGSYPWAMIYKVPSPPARGIQYVAWWAQPVERGER